MRTQKGSETGEVEALAVCNDLLFCVHDLYTCLMVDKYVRHAFIDHRKLSPRNPDFNRFQ